MSNEMNPQNGHINLMISIILGISAWFIDNVDILIKLIIGLTSSAAAVASFINYIYSIKEKRRNLKEKDKQQ